MFPSSGVGESDTVSLKDVPRGQIGSSSTASASTSASSTSSGGFARNFASQLAAGAVGAAVGATGAELQGAGGLSNWVLTQAQALFDVSTDDIVRRLKLVLMPNPNSPDRLGQEELRAKPDFYGPFWIATTVVLFLAATGNFARLLECAHPAQFKADYNLAPIAASLVYGGLLAVPLVARASLFFSGEEVESIDFKQLICICGYALAPAIPMSILCIVPLDSFRWIFVLFGLSIALYFLHTNLLKDISAKTRWVQMTLVASPVIFQVLVFFVYRVHFFSGLRV